MPQHTESVDLRTWLESLSYNGLRALESPEPTFLPNGRRLRGIDFGRGLWLLRDRSWALVESDGPHVRTLTSLSDNDVLGRVPLSAIISTFKQMCRERATRRETQ